MRISEGFLLDFTAQNWKGKQDSQKQRNEYSIKEKLKDKN